VTFLFIQIALLLSSLISIPMVQQINSAQLCQLIEVLCFFFSKNILVCQCPVVHFCLNINDLNRQKTNDLRFLYKNNVLRSFYTIFQVCVWITLRFHVTAENFIKRQEQKENGHLKKKKQTQNNTQLSIIFQIMSVVQFILICNV
jgi:hypothetical protein